MGIDHNEVYQHNKHFKFLSISCYSNIYNMKFCMGIDHNEVYQHNKHFKFLSICNLKSR